MWLFKQPWVWFIIIFDILLYTFYKKIIGMAGEHWVKKELKKLSSEYLILNDIMFKTNDGHTHQIDHIVVSKYGIFVIETKQYNGYIKGNDYDKKWEIYSGKKKFYINNPVHQNYGHVQSLKDILSINDNSFISIVCISSRAKTNIKSDVVILLPYLIDKILSYKEERIPNYVEIYNTLCNLNIKDFRERRKHVKDAKKTKIQKEKLSLNKCPKCGGDLVVRNGKYGTFIGCSNYPKCKFTKRQ